MKELPRGARLYWFAVVASAAAVVAFASSRALTSFHEFGVRTWVSVLALVCLAFICERMSIPLMSFEDEAATHSIGSVAGIAAVIVLPWYIAIPLLPVAIAWSQRGRSAVKALFNISHSALSVAAAAAVFQLAGGTAALHTTNPSSAARSLGVMVAMAVVYYVFGSGLVSAMVGQASGQRVWDVYHANHLNTMLQEATAIGLGMLLGGFWLYNPAFTPFVGLPVVMAYFSIETFVRIQQETRSAVLEMAKSIDLRDAATHLHSQRVAKLSVALARELGLSQEQIANIELSSLVHDIGKIGIPNEILNKPGKLTPEERTQMEAHSVIGYEMLRHYKQFRKGLDIVRSHHERMDGTGYPDGIPAHKISLEARIVCIADAYEAMTADRPYRAAMPAEVAYGRLVESAGSQFDAALVPYFRGALVKSEGFGQVRAPETEEVARPAPTPHPVASTPHEAPLTAAPVSPPSMVLRPLTAGRVHRIRRVPITSRHCRPAAMSRGSDIDG